VITTLLGNAGQLPLVIVQLNVLGPIPRLVIVVVALLGDVIVPVPETTAQVPVPASGTLAAIVAVEEQTVCAGPAAAGVGGLSIVIVTSLVLGVQLAPPVTVHRKVTELP
jgi:hypothetical protein